MAEFTDYTVTQGERWDTIAYNAYDNPYAYSGIIEANPQYRNVVVFDQANPPIVLKVPVLESTDTTAIDPSLLPPWRQ